MDWNKCWKIRGGILLIASILIFSYCGSKKVDTDISQEEAIWKMADDIVANITIPEFQDKVYNIQDFGAIGDGKTNCSEGFKKAIEKCAAEGGGKVLVPAGEFLTGPIHMESNINLYLEEGAVIKFSTDPKDYTPLVFTRWEGVECMNFSPLVYAFEKENIAITGKGTLDGMAGPDNWWPWKGREDYGWVPGTPQQEDPSYRPTLFRMNHEGVPVAERIFGEGMYLRPQFLQPYKCKNVLIEGVTLKNSPMWVMNPVLCENVTIRDVKVFSHGPNSDGCDPEACKNVLIQGCYFDTGDDCIALKSGRNHDGFNKGIPCENVVIRDCEMKDGHGGVVIGSEISGGAKNIFAENCTMSSPNLERAIRIKTNKSRGGVIEKIYIRNIEVGEVSKGVIVLNMKYAHDGEPFEKIPVMKDIHISNITSQMSPVGIIILGLEQSPIQNVKIENVDLRNVKNSNIIEDTLNLQFVNVKINGETIIN
ncbi:MAG: glycoside hydrolase family 28 protein [Bacteroidales bacterium]|nr:glycoside hydrolase family 28 protein [Bacteroidales bacterium]